MGLFSFVGKLFGGGGSKSSQKSSQTTTVKNNVEVNFDVDKLAETLEKNTLRDIFFKSRLAVKELSVKEKEQKTKEDSLKLSALALKQQMKTDENMFYLAIVGIGLTLITFIYNKSKKGKK